jgi:hypothetical protein
MPKSGGTSKPNLIGVISPDRLSPSIGVRFASNRGIPVGIAMQGKKYSPTKYSSNNGNTNTYHHREDPIVVRLIS